MDSKKYVIKPVISAVVMGIAAFGIYKLSFVLLHSNLISVILSIGFSAVVYFILTFAQKTLSEDEVCELPSGVRILGILKKIGFYK